MFCSPQPTPWDLCFTLFGFPVRVHPLFWLTSLMLGPTELDVPHAGVMIIIWLVCVSFSILLHELGHALAYRWYRCRGARIWLYWFGGLAGAEERPRRHWPNIAISLAGPGIQFLFCAAVYLSNEVSPWNFAAPPYTMFLYLDLIVINLFWPIFNLLPVYPLDGGQVTREACLWADIRKPVETSLVISIVTAGLMAALGLAVRTSPELIPEWLPWWFPIPGLFGVLLFASLGFASWQELQAQRNPYASSADRDW